jgi:hypothetical protein
MRATSAFASLLLAATLTLAPAAAAAGAQPRELRGHPRRHQKHTPAPALPAAYAGTASGSWEGVSSGADGSSTVRVSWSASGLRFDNTHPGGSRRALYALKGGTLAVNVSVSEAFPGDPCEPSAFTASLSLPAEAPYTTPSGPPSTGGSLSVVRVGAGGVGYQGRARWVEADVTARGTTVGLCPVGQLCNGNAPPHCYSEPGLKQEQLYQTWFDTGTGLRPGGRGGTLSGSASSSEGEAPYIQTYHWSWSFAPARGAAAPPSRHR